MKKLLFFFLILDMALLFSCNKSDKIIPINPNDSIPWLLSSAKKTIVGGNTLTVRFYYNSDNLPDSATLIGTEINVGTTQYSTSYYTYDIGNKLTKLERHDSVKIYTFPRTWHTLDTKFDNFSYDELGRLLTYSREFIEKDSIGNVKSNQTFNYSLTYGPNYIKKSTATENQIYTLDENHNIIKYDHVFNGSDTLTTLRGAYDSSPNPLSLTNLTFSAYPELKIGNQDLDMIISKNNVLNEQFTTNKSFVYTYNSDSLVHTMVYPKTYNIVYSYIEKL